MLAHFQISSIVIFELLVPPLAAASGLPSQCASYTVWDQWQRNASQTYGLCCTEWLGSDCGIGGSMWVRFERAAGTKMHSGPFQSGKCGGAYAAKLVDSNSHDGINEGSSVTRGAMWSRGDTFDIEVTNCSSFFVYLVSPPPFCGAWANYCGDGLPWYVTTTTSTTATTATTWDVTLGPPSQCFSNSYTVWGEWQRNASQTYGSCCAEWLSSDCGIGNSMWVRFQGAAGTRMYSGAWQSGKCGGAHAAKLTDIVAHHGVTKYSTETRTVDWSNGDTRWREIAITNCSDFFVYRVRKPPFCNAWVNYCGDGIHRTESVGATTTTSITSISGGMSQCESQFMVGAMVCMDDSQGGDCGNACQGQVSRVLPMCYGHEMTYMDGMGQVNIKEFFYGLQQKCRGGGSPTPSWSPIPYWSPSPL